MAQMNVGSGASTKKPSYKLPTNKSLLSVILPKKTTPAPAPAKKKYATGTGVEAYGAATNIKKGLNINGKPVTSTVSKPAAPISQAAFNAASAPKATMNLGGGNRSGFNGGSVGGNSGGFQAQVAYAPPPPPPITQTEEQMRSWSLRALNGDQVAIDFLNGNNLSAMSGQALWKNFDPTKGFGSHTAQATYLNDMAEGDYAKNFDNEWYNKYNESILGNKPMDDWETSLYNDIVGRRNLDDYNNPYVQAALQLEKDKKGALSAQDVALNQGMATMDANSFQQFQQLKQGMSQRGMSDSGIAADAYMRAQMGNNQNYQAAFAEGALNKSQTESQYNEAINQAKLGKWDYDQQLQQSQSEQQIKLQEIQNDQDKWLTESTGSVFLNGQRIMVDGKPLTTVEWEKLSEEKRSNLAQESMEGQKNAWDYQLGSEKNQLGWDSNSIKRQQVGVDLQIATSKLQLDYAKLDYNYAQLESNNLQAQDKIRIASENAQTGADKSKITALGQQLDSLTKQITAIQKAGKKPSKTLVDQYNNVAGQLQALAGNF